MRPVITDVDKKENNLGKRFTDFDVQLNISRKSVSLSFVLG